MISLIADSTMAAVLGQAKEVAEIRDASGTVIGFFAPITGANGCVNSHSVPVLDPAELKRRREDNAHNVSTKELFEYLKTLTSDEATRAYLLEKIERLAERHKWTTP